MLRSRFLALPILTTVGPIIYNWVGTLRKPLVSNPQHFVQPKFTDFGDTRIHSENGLTVKANDVFGITIAFTATYDSQPYSDAATEVESLDTNLKTSLNFSF